MFRSLAFTSLAGLLLIAAIRPADTYDLVPRFTAGMQLETPGTLTFLGDLDEVTAEMGGNDILGGTVGANIEAAMSWSESDEILETKDGEIVKLRRTYTELAWSVQAEAEAGGESESFDETGEEDDLVGRVVEITVDEDGEMTVVDVSEGDLEALDSEKLDSLGSVSPFRTFLPTEPIEEGESWDAKGAFAEIAEELRKGANADGDIETFETLLSFLEEYGSAQATGTLVGVEDEMAEISWEITVSLEIPDVLSVARQFGLGDELNEMPPSAAASMYLEMEIEGSGIFDLEHHQLTKMEMEGELSFSAEGSIDEDQVSIDAEASASGTYQLKTGVNVL